MNSKLNWSVLVFLLLAGCNLNAQGKLSQAESNLENTTLNEIDLRCEKGKQAAEEDYQNNDLGYYFFGRISPKFNTWMRLMQEEYKLKIKGGGDILSKEGDCYNEVMREMIKVRFGIDAFDRITNKVDSLYAIGLGDRPAEYKGGEEAMLKYIYCSLEKNLLSENNKEVPEIIIRFSIDEEGKVINEGVVRKNKFAQANKQYEKIANEIIDNMPDWLPAIENKKGVFYKGFYLPIRFVKEAVENYCN